MPVGDRRTGRLALRINRPSVEACRRRVLDAAASAPTPSTTPRRREDSGGNAPSAASDFSAHQPLTRSNQDAGASIAFLSGWTPNSANLSRLLSLGRSPMSAHRQPQKNLREGSNQARIKRLIWLSRKNSPCAAKILVPPAGFEPARTPHTANVTTSKYTALP